MKVIGLLIPMIALSSSVAFADEFKITYPTENLTVPGRIVEVTGVGAVMGSTIEVSVLTNEWYKQTCEIEMEDDGEWACSPVHLAGQDEDNNHSIKAVMRKGGKKLGKSSVRGVKRK